MEKLQDFLLNLQIYDWITIIYIIVGIASFIWASIGNNYVFGLIDRKKMKKVKIIESKQKECDTFYEEIRRSWLREQNIWKSIEYFLIGLSYLSMVVVIYMTVDNIVDGDLLKIKTTFYAIINLLASTFKDYLEPGKKSLGLRKAFIVLNEANLKYKHGYCDDNELNQAVIDGEKIITEYIYND